MCCACGGGATTAPTPAPTPTPPPTPTATPSPPTASTTPSTVTISGAFRATVAASEAEAFISNSDVEDSFVASIAQTAGVSESMVEVTLSVVSSSGRRLSTSDSEVEVVITYTITAQVGDSNDANVISQSTLDSMVDTLSSTTATEFVASFNSKFQTTNSTSSFSTVVAVVGSETAPTVVTLPPASSRAQATFPKMLLLATVCGLML